MSDVSFTGSGIVVITSLLGALAGVIGILFRQLMAAQAAQYTAVMATKDAALLSVVASKDAAYSELRTDRDNYRRMALQAALVMEQKANNDRAARGEPPLNYAAPVIAEHNSPVTRRQQDAADFATLRAKIVTAASDLQVAVPEIDVVEHPNTGDLTTTPRRPMATMAAAAPGQPISIHHGVVAGMIEIAGEGEVHALIADATITGTVVSASPLSGGTGEANPKDEVVITHPDDFKISPDGRTE